MTLDVKILYFLNGFVGKSGFSDGIFLFFSSYLPFLLILAFLFLLFFSSYSRKDSLYIFATAIISAFVARFWAVGLIRLFFKRPRPFLTHELNTLLTSTEWSFPSGHSAFFFAMATVIYLYNKKWGLWFFVAAILMNISRVIGGVHYPSDILGGAFVGIIVGYLIFRLVKQRKSKEHLTIS